MQKKVLSEIDLYYGMIDMPKGFEINREKLQSDILSSQIKNSESVTCDFKISCCNLSRSMSQSLGISTVP